MQSSGGGEKQIDISFTLFELIELTKLMMIGDIAANVNVCHLVELIPLKWAQPNGNGYKHEATKAMTGRN